MAGTLYTVHDCADNKYFVLESVDPVSTLTQYAMYAFNGHFLCNLELFFINPYDTDVVLIVFFNELHGHFTITNQTDSNTQMALPASITKHSCLKRHITKFSR